MAAPSNRWVLGHLRLERAVRSWRSAPDADIHTEFCARKGRFQPWLCVGTCFVDTAVEWPESHSALRSERHGKQPHMARRRADPHGPSPTRASTPLGITYPALVKRPCHHSPEAMSPSALAGRCHADPFRGRGHTLYGPSPP